jgi:hypothetical protein
VLTESTDSSILYVLGRVEADGGECFMGCQSYPLCSFSSDLMEFLHGFPRSSVICSHIDFCELIVGVVELAEHFVPFAFIDLQL